MTPRMKRLVIGLCIAGGLCVVGQFVVGVVLGFRAGRATAVEQQRGAEKRVGPEERGNPPP